MNNQKRKYRCIGLILFIMCFAWMPVSASAQWDYNDFQYEETEDSVTIYAYAGNAVEVVIPASIHDKPVTAIGEYAFLLCNTVEIIKVPSSVVTISESAFTGASNLREVVLASEDTTIQKPEAASTTNANNNEETSTSTDVEKKDSENGDSEIEQNKNEPNESNNQNAAEQTDYVVTIDKSVDAQSEAESTDKALDVADQSAMTEDENSQSDEMGGILDGLGDTNDVTAKLADTEQSASKTIPVVPVAVGICVLFVAVMALLFYKKKSFRGKK